MLSFHHAILAARKRRRDPFDDADFIDVRLLHNPLYNGPQAVIPTNVYIRPDERWASAKRHHFALFPLISTICGLHTPQAPAPVQAQEAEEEDPDEEDTPECGDTHHSNSEDDMDPESGPAHEPPPGEQSGDNDDNSNEEAPPGAPASTADASPMNEVASNGAVEGSRFAVDGSNSGQDPGASHLPDTPQLTVGILSASVVDTEAKNPAGNSRSHSAIRPVAGETSRVLPTPTLTAMSQGAATAPQLDDEAHSPAQRAIDRLGARVSQDTPPYAPLKNAPATEPTTTAPLASGITDAPNIVEPGASAISDHDASQIDAAEAILELPDCPDSARQRHLKLATALEGDLKRMVDEQAQVAGAIIRMLRRPHRKNTGRHAANTAKILTAVVLTFAYAGRVDNVDELALDVIQHSEHTGDFKSSNINDRIP